MKVILISSFSCFAASAAVLTLTPGPRTDDPVTGVNDWTLDAGLFLPGLPANPNRVVFEAGGDGTGSALVVIGSDLVYYYDQGGFTVSTPAGDGFMSIDISSFAGKAISIRLDADLSTATDVVTLSASDGSSILSNTLSLGADVASIAGGNDTGFGNVAADLAGLDESVEAGSPDMAQFQNAAYFPGGANTLGEGQIAGTLYTGADQAPGDLPDPASWGLVPEPSSTLLIGTALAFGAMKRRRA